MAKPRKGGGQCVGKRWTGTDSSSSGQPGADLPASSTLYPESETRSTQARTCGELSHPATRTRGASATTSVLQNLRQARRVRAPGIALQGAGAHLGLVGELSVLPPVPEVHERRRDRFFVLRIRHQA